MGMRAATGEEQQLIGMLMLGLGAAFSGWAGYLATRTRNRIATSDVVTGIVVDVKRMGSSEGRSYKVIVEYTDARGQTRRYTSRAAASGWGDMKGQPMELLVRRDDPTDARVRQWWVQWMQSTMIAGTAAICYVVGVVLLLAG